MEKQIKTIDAPELAPGISAADVFKYLPLLAELIASLETGTGTFSTWTPKGKRWVRVQDKPFKAEP